MGHVISHEGTIYFSGGAHSSREPRASLGVAPESSVFLSIVLTLADIFVLVQQLQHPRCVGLLLNHVNFHREP